MDVIVIAVLVLLALCWFGWQVWQSLHDDASPVYVVLVDGTTVASGALKECTFSVPERPAVVIHVAEGKAAFQASDCPDQICVRTGYIASSGQSAACLPNGVILLIRGGTSEDADGVDAVAGLSPISGLHPVAGLSPVGGLHPVAGLSSVAGLHPVGVTVTGLFLSGLAFLDLL